jgi:hypothetical protein
MPVPAAIHAARQRGHFGSRNAIAPGSTLPRAFTHRRAGLLFGAAPRA